jgi:hypothetical protein
MCHVILDVMDGWFRKIKLNILKIFRKSHSKNNKCDCNCAEDMLDWQVVNKELK